MRGGVTRGRGGRRRDSRERREGGDSRERRGATHVGAHAERVLRVRLVHQAAQVGQLRLHGLEAGTLLTHQLRGLSACGIQRRGSAHGLL